jgi:Tfp pilus assembly PilM family ATPase
MHGFFSRPGIGLDISSRMAHLGVVRRSGSALTALASRSVTLGQGVVEENYAVPGIRDREGLAAALRGLLEEPAAARPTRTALSLPDALFRVQLFDFDELPPRNRERERLVRWRFEKSAAFDTADTLLRFQVLPRAGRGFTALSCIAKREVIAAYEELVLGLGLEAWNVGPSSFHALNFYAAAVASPPDAPCGMVWVTESSYSTIILEGGVPRFYRFREIKPGAAGDAAARITRELEDALHFYTHRDPQQALSLTRLCLAGDSPVLAPLADGLQGATSMTIHLLRPVSAGAASGVADGSAPALGAGGAL